MDKFVTLRTYMYPIEAAIFRCKLEAAGIECFLKNELTVQVNPLYSNAIGGVELQVNEEDVETAEEILREDRNTGGSDTEDASV
jgi:hypothetical protein